MTGGCRICELNERAPELPLRERLHEDAAFRVSHGWSSLPGWLVVVARRHITHLGELAEDEAAGLGTLLRAATGALRQVVGCERTYVMLFAEQEGFRHLHLHVVPRMDGFGPDERATGVFRFLNVPESEQVPVAERERLARELGAAIRAALA